MVCGDTGKVSEEDITTMKLILEAAPDIGMNYGLIVNLLSKDTLVHLQKDSEDFLNDLFREIPKKIQCPSNRVLFFEEIEELKELEDVVLPENDPNSLKLQEFLYVQNLEFGVENVALLNATIKSKCQSRGSLLSQKKREKGSWTN